MITGTTKELSRDALTLLPYKIDKIGTTNPDKLGEFSRLLGYQVTGTKLEIPELQPSKLETQMLHQHRYEEVAASIASTKAQLAFKQHGFPILIEDTFYGAYGFHSLPGAFAAQLDSKQWNLDLCNAIHLLPTMNGEKRSDKALAIVSLAIWDGNEHMPPLIWQGLTSGRVPPQPRGEFGFGWDPIFIPDGSDKTFGEMRPEEKDQFSMRKKAIAKITQKT